MPRIDVRVPDGGIVTVEAPEGASDDQILSFVKSQYQPAPPPRAWSDVPMEALGNLPESFGNLVVDTVRPILHPVETAQSLASLGKGAYKNVAGGYDPSDPDVMAADAVGQLLKERYTTGDGIKNYIAMDPAGALGDLATILTAGGGLASRAPGTVGKAGRLARTAGRAIDPIAAPVNVAGKAVNLAIDPGLTHVLGTTTGAQAQPIREAARAGASSMKETGGRFLPHMRGTAHTNEIVDQAKTAVENLRRTRSAAYQASSGWKTDPTVLDFKPIEKAYVDLYKSMTFRGHMKVGKATMRKMQEIGDAIKEWKADPLSHNVEGLDALKQSISNMKPAAEDLQGQRAVTTMRNAIKDSIMKQAPAYAETMRDYETASSLITELETGLSLGNKAQAETSLRKLLSIMRNNANTNFGRRKELGDVLAGAGASDLMPMMAGEALNSWTPRGLQQLAATGTLGAAALTQSPMALMLLAAQSPRVVGEGAYYAGKAGAAVGDVAKRLRSMIQPVTPTDIGQLLYQSGRAAEESRREPLRINVRNIRGR